MISAIIVNFNAGPLLAHNLRHLRNSRLDVPLEVIVIDNASIDGSVDGVTNMVDTMVRNSSNRGFAAACNQGASLAQGEYLLFINPDCAVEPGAIAHALGALRVYPRAGMAGALILNEDGSEQRGCRRAIPDPRRSLYRLSGLSRCFPKHFSDFNSVGLALPAAPTPVEAISGAFMMMSREAFDLTGGWDEGYFLHCEDLDLCQRVRDAGHDVLFVPAARATHVQGTSSRGRPIRVEWHKHRGMWRFYRKFQAARNPSAFNTLVRLGIAAHFVLKAARLAPRSLRLALTKAAQ